MIESEMKRPAREFQGTAQKIDNTGTRKQNYRRPDSSSRTGLSGLLGRLFLPLQTFAFSPSLLVLVDRGFLFLPFLPFSFYIDCHV